MKNLMKKAAIASAVCASMMATQAGAAIVTDVTLTDSVNSTNIFSGSWDLASQGTLSLDSINDQVFNGGTHAAANRWFMNITLSSVAANETVQALLDLGFTTLDGSNNISFPTHNGLTQTTSSNGVLAPSTLSPDANRIYTTSYALNVSQSVTPVPVPAAAWLMLSGIGAFGFMKRRKNAGQITAA
ncbi:MAG: VPLPA-CTERM sorting domain-containing protein [bacterium]